MIRDFTEIVQEEMHDAIKDSLSDQVIYSSHNYDDKTVPAFQRIFMAGRTYDPCHI